MLLSFYCCVNKWDAMKKVDGRTSETSSTQRPSQPQNTTIFEGTFVRVGLFRCAPEDDLFRNDRRALGYHIVFPRSSVAIIYEGQPPVVTTPNLVMFYNEGQRYRREKVSDAGDICEYLTFAPKVLLDTLRHYEPGIVERPERPFSFTHRPSDAQSYLMQRLLVEHIRTETTVDPLYVEEVALHVLARVIERSGVGERRQQATAATVRAHEALANDLKRLLATRFQESLTLKEIATELYTSPYHLCRVFRSQTGQTIHRYRNQMRLRAGLDYVLQSERDLASIALHLGYASHSHFTNAFRRAFHKTPSELRRGLARAHLAQIRKH